MLKGAAVNDCQPNCNPIAWLVLPFGCMAVILLDSVVQSLLSSINDTGQREYCSAGYNVPPATGASLVVSKFWSRSVTQPFQVLVALAIQACSWFPLVVLQVMPLPLPEQEQLVWPVQLQELPVQL